MHTRQDLADFQNGETRLVYARYKDGRPGLYYVENGTAKDIRELTREELLCPLPDCPMPALKVMSRYPRGRDGFSHLPGAGRHAAEQLFHIQGKARIAQWLRRKYPSSEVREEEASDTDRTQIADVMITAPNGKRVAFEIQYAALTPADWTRRHQSYVDQGIADVWLFGHTGAQRRAREPRYMRDSDVKLNPTHNAVLAACLPLPWLNPILGQVATATKDVRFGQEIYTVPAADRTGYTRIEELDAFEVKPDGLWSEATRSYARNAAALHTAQRLAAEKEAREEEEGRRRRQAEADQKSRARAQWLASEFRASVLAQFGGQWPVFLDVETLVAAAVPDPQWQAHLFLERESLADDDGRLTVKSCIAALPGVFPSNRIALIAISRWFEAMAEHRYLVRVPDFGGATGVKYVLANPSRPTHETNDHQQRRSSPGPAPQTHWQTSGTSSPRQPTPNPTYERVDRGPGRCGICRMPLNPDCSHQGVCQRY